MLVVSNTSPLSNLEAKAGLVLLDESAARSPAAKVGVPFAGVLGILRWARQTKRIPSLKLSPPRKAALDVPRNAGNSQKVLSRTRNFGYLAIVNAVLENPGRVWTYEEYLGLNDEGYFEIVNGKALMSPAPELFRQRWARKIFVAVERHVGAGKLGEVFFAPVDVVLDETNVVQPDLIFVSTANAGILDRRGVMGAPDLIVEIISPSSLRRDRYDKRELYARFGVKEFWLADAANHSIEVLSLRQNSYHLLSCATSAGKVRSEVLPGFELDLAWLA